MGVIRLDGKQAFLESPKKREAVGWEFESVRKSCKELWMIRSRPISVWSDIDVGIIGNDSGSRHELQKLQRSPDSNCWSILFASAAGSIGARTNVAVMVVGCTRTPAL